MVKDKLRVLSFDLGSMLGWACSTIDLTNPNGASIIINDSGTIDLNSIARSRSNQYSNAFSPFLIKMRVFEEVTASLMDRIQFDAYASEDVFLNHSFMTSFKSLLIYIYTLEKMVAERKNSILYKIPPTSVKSHASDFGFSNKDEIMAAILANPRIIFKNPNPILDEHSSDAIAVNYAFLKEYLTFNIGG